MQKSAQLIVKKNPNPTLFNIQNRPNVSSKT